MHLLTCNACIRQTLPAASMQVTELPRVRFACGDLLCLPCCRESSGEHGQRYDNLVGQAKEQWKGQTASDLCECADAHSCALGDGFSSQKFSAVSKSAVVHHECDEAVMEQAEHSTQVSSIASNIQLIGADPNAHGQAKATSEGTDEKKKKM